MKLSSWRKFRLTIIGQGRRQLSVKKPPQPGKCDGQSLGVKPPKRGNREADPLKRNFTCMFHATKVDVGPVGRNAQAMTRKLNHWGYYVMATRESAYPPSWRWRVVRRGKPMGVRIEGGGFTTYETARLAGNRALADFLQQLELEKFRID